MDWLYGDLNPLAPPTPQKDMRHDSHERPFFPEVYMRKTQGDNETGSASPYFQLVYKRRAQCSINEGSKQALCSTLSRVSTVGDGECIAILDRLQQPEVTQASNEQIPVASGDDYDHLLRTPKKAMDSHVRQKKKGSFKSLVCLPHSVEQECEVSLNKCSSLVESFDPTNDDLLGYTKHKKRSRNREKAVGGDSILEYMKHRKRNRKHIKAVNEAEYALKPHGGGNMIVPHGHLSVTIKKQRSPQAKAKAKVDLDQETKREWRLLIGEDRSDGAGGMDMEHEKWWEKERQVFHGRADAFIACMHHIQGNRRFSKWNGSVVDSVVGAFLTQNVADYLSSSAFMTLAATFPPLSSSSKSKETNADMMKTSTEQGDGSTPAFADTVKEQEKMPIPEEEPERGKSPLRTKKLNSATKKMFDRKALQKEAFANGANKERSNETMDSVDWDSVRNADVDKISEAIRERGMENKLARRIKLFLDSLVQDHGSIDIEWLRNVPPEKAKKYLLSFEGMGIKSVECVRLLSLHQSAFPVDSNVGRVCVRLGWVPLQPLPESLQLHLLEQYPLIQKIQAYLWPRLCTLDQRTLYELHYQMITFGKVFCRKAKPNCHACPMRGECKHFASAFASSRLLLEGPEEERSTTTRITSTPENDRDQDFRLAAQSQLKSGQPENGNINNNIKFIIEEPATPHESTQCLGGDIEDSFYEDPEPIPIINLISEEFSKNTWKNYMQENRFEIQDDEMSKALVAITENAASIPTPKLRNVNRLRTWRHVYKLPDSHPLLEGMDKRWPEDPCPYLLATWTAGETSESIEPPQSCCISLGSTELCESDTCFGCNSVREAQTQTIRGTILIPCRTALRGSFPLNGTYFQVNEVFADHMTSRKPIDVPRKLIWNLDRCTVAFGTSVATIFQGLTLDEIRLSFCKAATRNVKEHK